MINTKSYELNIEPYVFWIHYEQVFYSQVLGRLGWLFVVWFDLRGRPVMYIWWRGESSWLDNHCFTSYASSWWWFSARHPHVVMDNPYNDFEGLDTDSDLDELDIELDEVLNQTHMVM